MTSPPVAVATAARARRVARTLWTSPALRVAIVQALSGLGFAVGNLLLARTLSPHEFGSFSLVVALLNVTVGLAPLGADGAVNRRTIDPGVRLLRRVAASAVLVGGVTAVLAHVLYPELPSTLLPLLWVAIVFGGLNFVAAAQFQSLHRFRISLVLLQTVNLSAAVAAVLTMVTGIRRAELPVAFIGGAFLVSATYGWARLRRRHRVPRERRDPFLWGEALSFVGLQASAALLSQLERLVTGRALGFADLATYSVLAAVATSPYRMLRLGIGYTMLPRLRAADSVRERRRLVRHELLTVLGVVAAGSVAVWFLTPLVLGVVVPGKYVIPGALLFAAIATGILKALEAFPRSVVNALASPRELAWLNGMGWAAIASGALAAGWASRWGLLGIVYGAGVGWILRLTVSSTIAVRHLRHRPQR